MKYYYETTYSTILPNGTNYVKKTIQYSPDGETEITKTYTTPIAKPKKKVEQEHYLTDEELNEVLEEMGIEEA